jgi:hypothetical protein
MLAPMVDALRLQVALAALVLAAPMGCAAAPRYFQVDTVTEAPGGMWIAGTQGVAAFSDGRTVTRRDYRAAGPSWKYEPSPVQAARVVMIGGEAWLFSRAGDLMRWGPGGWSSFAARWPPVPSPYPAQVDFAGLGPDGSLLVQLHEATLAWSSPAAIGARWTTERTPHYFPWIGWDGGALFGLGWQGSGPMRALYRRAAADHWDLVSALGSEDQAGQVLGVIRIPGGPLAVVANNGLLVVEEGRPPRLVELDTLLAGKHPTTQTAALAVAGAAATAQGSAAAVQASPGTAAPAAPGAAAPVSRVPTGHDLQAAGPVVPIMGEGEGKAARTSSIHAVLGASGHGPLLVVYGTQNAIVEIGASGVTVTPCLGLDAWIVGAATTPAGLRLVTRKAALVEVGAGTPCRLVSAAAIREDEGG